MTDVAAPPLTAAPSRGLGITALVFALAPALLLAIVFAIPYLFTGSPDNLGWAFAFAASLIYVGPVLALVALVLGIIAVRKNRGRGLGIAAIVIGGLLFLYWAASIVFAGLAYLAYSSY